MAIARRAGIPITFEGYSNNYDKANKLRAFGLTAKESGFANDVVREGEFLGKTMPDIVRPDMYQHSFADQDGFDPRSARQRKAPRVGMPFSEDEFQPRPDYARRRRPSF